ncbi:hypothetical protein OAT84_03060 [Gammaproteobacteria bacterium]|nr:hypothetical protein [Gammaproteobacteria bacterium]
MPVHSGKSRLNAMSLLGDKYLINLFKTSLVDIISKLAKPNKKQHVMLQSLLDTIKSIETREAALALIVKELSQASPHTIQLLRHIQYIIQSVIIIDPYSLIASHFNLNIHNLKTLICGYIGKCEFTCKPFSPQTPEYDFINIIPNSESEALCGKLPTGEICICFNWGSEHIDELTTVAVMPYGERKTPVHQFKNFGYQSFESASLFGKDFFTTMVLKNEHEFSVYGVIPHILFINEVNDFPHRQLVEAIFKQSVPIEMANIYLELCAISKLRASQSIIISTVSKQCKLTEAQNMML